MEALAAGSGGSVVTDCRYRPGRPAAFYGVTPESLECFAKATASGLNWYYVDHGYFGRGDYYRITKNREQIETNNWLPNMQRLAVHGVKFKPWRARGEHILVCTQSDWWHERHTGMSAFEWSRRIVHSLQQHTSRPIRIRHKPETAKGVDAASIAKTQATIEADLENCHALVTYTSNAAVDAVLRGVPVFVSQESAAVSVGQPLSRLPYIERPSRPVTRVEWAGVLADHQWSFDEIRSGVAWKALQR